MNLNKISDKIVFKTLKFGFFALCLSMANASVYAQSALETFILYENEIPEGCVVQIPNDMGDNLYFAYFAEPDRVEADLTACASMGLIDCEIVVLRCAEALAPGTGSQLYSFLTGPVAFRPLGFDPMVNVATIDDIVSAVALATHGSGEGVFNIPGYDTLPLSLAIRKFGTVGLPAPGLVIRPLYALRHLTTGAQFSYGLNKNRMHLGLVLNGTRAEKVLGYTPSHPVDWPVDAD